MGPSKSIGTPVKCPSCRHPNLAIEIWCERCGTPLDWKPEPASPREPAAKRDVAPKHEPVPNYFEPPEAPEPTPLAVPRSQPALVKAGTKSVPKRYCWSCGSPNGADDRFCGRCGNQLSDAGSQAATARSTATGAAPKTSSPASPRLRLPDLKLPHWRLPQLKLPRWQAPAMPALRLPAFHLPRTVMLAGIVLLALLLVPLAAALLSSGRQVADRQSTATKHSPSASATGFPSGSPQAVALAGVEASTHLKYARSCSGTTPCLSMTGQTIGQDAAAMVFTTAHTGGRECAGYVVHKGGAWQLLSTLCAAPNQLSPLVGRKATVHVPGNCANVRSAPGLQAGRVACLNDGTAVQVDGGPAYADQLMWWHTSRGWIAHTVLLAG